MYTGNNTNICMFRLVTKADSAVLTSKFDEIRVVTRVSEMGFRGFQRSYPFLRTIKLLLDCLRYFTNLCPHAGNSFNIQYIGLGDQYDTIETN